MKKRFIISIIFMNTFLISSEVKTIKEIKEDNKKDVIPTASYFIIHRPTGCFNHIGHGPKNLPVNKCTSHMALTGKSIVTYHNRDDIFINSQKFDDIDIKSVACKARRRLDVNYKPLANLFEFETDKSGRKWCIAYNYTSYLFNLFPAKKTHLVAIPLAENKLSEHDIKMMSEYVEISYASFSSLPT